MANLAIIFLLFPFLLSAAHVVRHDHHEHVARRSLPSESWFQPRDHPIHDLFPRDADASFPTVGTPAWSAGFPPAQGPPDSSKLPTAWVNALNAAVAAGKIPNIPQSSSPNGGNPVYPTGFDPLSTQVCSSTYKQCKIPGDFWNAPDGYLGLQFDDGPTAASPTLYNFLTQNNEKATHFMIGVQILNYPQQFLQAFNNGDDIAVHTWSHPQMTTLSNLDVVAQLGWTMLLIHNSTGGRVPKYWRPPTGDSDMRVHSIAKEVFALETIIWNQDTEDWTLGSTPPGTTLQAINTSMTQWLTGPKSPGLIILEHELTDMSVSAFMSAYPVIKQNGWKTASIASLLGGGSAYRNAGATGPVSAAGILDFADSVGPSTVGATSSSTSATTTSGTTTVGTTTTQTTNPQTTSPNASSRLLGGAHILPWTILLSTLCYLLV